MVKRPLTMLQRILKQYPRFFDKSEDSNNLKFIKGYSEQLKWLETEVFKIELAKRMERPLKIYRNQIAPHTYEMHFEVVLEDIKRVKVYKDLEEDELIFDSMDLPEGTDFYSYIYYSTDEVNVIPTQKYYMTVEDYNETKFVKGFPHNLEPTGDFYDHDEVLDKFGLILGVPRRLYKSSIPENDYPQTYPPFCVDVKEWDYFYEQRLKEFVDEYEDLSLAALELKKIWGITPTIQGRWRALCFMDESNQDDKFMSTDEWDYPVYDVSANLDLIPKNIDIPDGNTIQQVLDRTFPLSKKAYWKLLVYLNNSIQVQGIVDEVKFNLQAQQMFETLTDSLITTVTDTRTNHEVLSDYVLFGMSGILDIDGLSDKLALYEYYAALLQDTDVDFASDSLTNCSIIGTGSSAYVKLNAISGNQGPRASQDQTTSGNRANPPYWNYGGDTPLSRLEVQDDTGVRADPNAGQSTDMLIATNFGFSIPSNGTIVGIQAKIRRRQSGTNQANDSQVYLRLNGGNKGSNKASGAKWPQGYGDAYYGGSNDTWGTSWTPAEINSSTFGIGLVSVNASGLNQSHYVDYMSLQVWYLTAAGELMTQKIEKDVEQEEWFECQAGLTIPAQCGSDAVLFDVYKSGTDKVKAVFINSTYYNTFDVATLQAAGVTDLFVIASRFTDPLYSVTLPAAIARAAGSGIRVHAWIITFKDAAGAFTDPADPAIRADAQQHALNCLALGVDGVHFDYVRYPGTTGHKASDQTPHGFNNINQFLTDAQTAILASYPDAIITASVMPEMSINKDTYGQDYASMAPYLDWIMPMSYTGNFNQPASWVGTVSQYIYQRVAYSGCKVISTLQTYNSDSDLTTKTKAVLESEGQYAYDNHSDGLGLFRYGLIGAGAYPFPDEADSLVLSNQSTPFSLDGIENTNLKLKAKLKTADTNYSPQIDWIKVIGKKPY